MLSALLLGHQDEPLAPHDLWTAWGSDPLVVVATATAGVLYLRGRARSRAARQRPRTAAAVAGLVAVVVAVVSPLDAMATALASAHMVQHLLLVLVAAPLLAGAGVLSTIRSGIPHDVRQVVARVGRWQPARGLDRAATAPVAAWLLHAGVVWIWHTAALYEAAVRNPLVHAVEHASFLATALLFWGVILGVHRRRRTSAGAGILLVFAMALQGVVLAALLTFAGSPWYDSYASSTGAWGLDPLTDQQLAGVIMWVPGGLIYLCIALGLVAAWIREGDAPGVASVPRRAAQPVSVASSDDPDGAVSA